MLQLVLLLFFISRAETSEDNALVVNVDNTVRDCFAFVHHTGDFVSLFETPSDDVRRRSLAVEVKAKQNACLGILAAANTLLFFMPTPPRQGRITLSFDDILFLSKELKNSRIGKTLYVASEDGDSSNKFHQACDDKGPTLVIIETMDGDVFGGYADVSWTSRGYWEKSFNAFIFQLRFSKKRNHIKMRYDIRKGREFGAMKHSDSIGPGFGYVINIATSKRGTEYSFNKNSYFYEVPGEYFNGMKKYRINDVIVLEVKRY